MGAKESSCFPTSYSIKKFCCAILPSIDVPTPSLDKMARHTMDSEIAMKVFDGGRLTTVPFPKSKFRFGRISFRFSDDRCPPTL